MTPVKVGPSKQRRAGYSPASAEVGRLGLHTRDRIVAVAEGLFSSRGYPGTSVEAIAKAVGGSRAVVYQYFEGKEQIFLELVRRCEPEVRRHVASLGRLAPDQDGMRNLHQWLQDWADLYDRFAVVLAELPGIGMVEIPTSESAAGLAREYESRVTARLVEAGLGGIDPEIASAVLLRVAHMVNLYRYRAMFALPSQSATTTSLAISLQLFLFPETPDDVVAAVCPATAPRVDSDTAILTIEDVLALTVGPVRQDILAAASLSFFERGYHAVAMEDIAAAADIGRATLYRHFSTKLAILEELTNWATVEGDHLARDLFVLGKEEGRLDSNALHNWLGRYLRFHRSYGGVVRAWHDGSLAPQLAEDVATRGLGPFGGAARSVLERTQLPTNMNEDVAVTVFLSVLGRVSEYALSKHNDETDYDSAGLMLLVLQRALRFAD